MEATQSPPARRFLRLPQVLARVPLSRTRVYELISAGRFPAPIRLSDRASGWVESEVNKWCDERVRESREPSA